MKRDGLGDRSSIRQQLILGALLVSAVVLPQVSSTAAGAEGEAIHLDLTVAVDTGADVCAATDSIPPVGPGTVVRFCYQVTNTGTQPLTRHDLASSVDGAVLTDFGFNLAPGASAFITQTEALTVDTTNSATWTARNPTNVPPLSATATDSVTVEVIGSNSAPVADDDAHSMDQGTVLSVAVPGVLGNDTDGDGDPLSVTVLGAPGNGVVVLSPDGAFVYTPDPGFAGVDSFTYTATDGTDSDTATVTITVDEVTAPTTPEPWLPTPPTTTPPTTPDPTTPGPTTPGPTTPTPTPPPVPPTPTTMPSAPPPTPTPTTPQSAGPGAVAPDASTRPVTTGGSLARTGSDTGTTVGMGLASLIVGLVLVVRRRRTYAGG